MEKILRKTGINQSLRLLLIVASLLFGSSANVWAEDTVVDFSAGLPSDWSKTAGNTANVSYGSPSFECLQLQKNTTINSPVYATAFESLKINIARSGNGTTLTLSYQIGKNAAVTIETFSLPSKGKFSEQIVNLPAAAQVEGVKFILTSATASYYVSKITLTPKTTSGGGKKAATVTFAQESYSVQTNGKITVSATKNSTSSPIVYSISPEDDNVLINANTGEIVAGKNPGTYTITASVSENESYTSASADCTLTVKAPSFNIAAPTYYKKITSTDELVLGTQYIIANIEQGQGLPASGTITTVATISEENKANITDNTLVKSEYVADFAVLTLQKDENDNYVLINEEGQYLTGANGTDLSWKDAKDTYSTWKISFDKSGNALIATTAETKSARIIMITSNSIKYYASSNNYTKVQLYQKVTDLAISTLTNGYATFVTDVPYVMPKGACGYAVTVAPHVGVITKTEAYKGGQPVPAQTALLIGGASGKYYPAVLKENVAPSYTRENYMEGKRTADGDTDSQRGGDVYYYKLALNSDGKPGFYYGKAGGAAFKLTKPTTAYLAVPQSITHVNGYLIDFDGEETGISTIAPTNGNANGAIYNLNGIRMAQTLRNLPKGVYIVNGKKVIK